MSNVTSITQARRPRSWNSSRWRWVKDVAADADLSHSAKLLAYVLVAQFAHHESAECTPGIEALAEAMATSPDTIKRALRALQEAGWIGRTDGRGRGRRAAIHFHMLRLAPGARPEIAPQNSPQNSLQNGAETTPETPRLKGGNSARFSPEKGGRDAPFSGAEKGADLRGKGCKSALPPRPPYIDKPNLNQMRAPARSPAPAQAPAQAHPREGRPQAAHSQAFNSQALKSQTSDPGPCPLGVVHPVAQGSWRARDWDRWLADQGLPDLEAIGRARDLAGERVWMLPSTAPPPDAGSWLHGAALRFFEWCMARRAISEGRMGDNG